MDEESLHVYVVGAALGGHEDIVEQAVCEGYRYLSAAVRCVATKSM